MKALLLALALFGCTSADEGAADAKGFFLPTGDKADNTAAPVIRTDAKGTTHAVYPAFIKGGAYYAVVGADAKTTRVVHFDTPDGTVTNAMLALDAAGHPRILLSGYQKAYFASCDASCGDASSWSIGAIADKGIDQDITGDALALDPAGHPRFLMHTHVAYLGIGQKDPVTTWWSCDASCTTAAGWTHSQLAADIWQGSTLRFDQAGTAKLATVTGNGTDQIVYYECAGACSKPDSWHGTLLGTAFDSTVDIVSIHPRVALALTSRGAPRIAVLARADDGKRGLAYMACDRECTSGAWTASVISKDDKVDSGFAIALDANDRAHVAFTYDYNIAIAVADAGGKLSTTIVAPSAALPADTIFLNYNCTVGGWLFHDPSISIGADGKSRIGFQARDASAAGPTTDHTHASCVAGTDMTWSRFVSL